MCRKNRDQGGTDDSWRLSDERLFVKRESFSRRAYWIGVKPRAGDANAILKISSKEMASRTGSQNRFSGVVR